MNEITPPQAPELEQSVLGAMINDSECIPEIIGILSPESFYDPKNAEIYRVIRSMFDAGRDIDLYTVATAYSQTRKIQFRDATPYLTKLTQKVGSGIHVFDHAMIVKGKQIQRDILLLGMNLVRKSSDNNENVSDLLDYVSKEVDSLMRNAIPGSEASHISVVIEKSLKEAENRAKQYGSGKPVGITSGLSLVDKYTGGWRGSQLIVLAARPAMGKTALMLHFAKEAAKQGVPVCIYSLEMSDDGLADRLLVSESGIDNSRYRSGNLNSSEWAKLEEANASISKLPIYIDANPGVSMRYIKARSTMMKMRGQCGMILIDYLQLVDAKSENKGRNREQEIAETSRLAKIIAKELNVPLIMLSQLNRNTDNRADKKPQLSDLRESGAIEQDADIVSFIYRPKYYDINEIAVPGEVGLQDTEGLGVLMIAKQRDGGTGDIFFGHNESMTRIYDWGEPTATKAEFPNNPF